MVAVAALLRDEVEAEDVVGDVEEDEAGADDVVAVASGEDTAGEGAFLRPGVVGLEDDGVDVVVGEEELVGAVGVDEAMAAAAAALNAGGFVHALPSGSFLGAAEDAEVDDGVDEEVDVDCVGVEGVAFPRAGLGGEPAADMAKKQKWRKYQPYYSCCHSRHR